MGEEKKAGLGRLVGVVAREAGMIDTDAPVSLVGAPGKKKGERWSQGTIELGKELIKKNLSGEQEVSDPGVRSAPAPVLGRERGLLHHLGRALQGVAHVPRPGLSLHCRVHDQGGGAVHPIHDARTKEGISVFQTAARVEMPDGSIAEFPVKFDLLPSGNAATEAPLVQESLHTSGVGSTPRW